MRRGTTLPELLLVLVLAGLLLGLAAATLRGPLDRTAVHGAARLARTLHTRARQLAVFRQREVLLALRPDTFAIAELEGTDTVRLVTLPGPAAEGTALAGPVRWLRFAPNGQTLGPGNGTWRFTRGDAVLDLVVSRLGRTRFVRPPS